ncbi:hypothetical protein D5S17_23910 [Pseudonocardiaceae bacterium YIM PH 21723]|nr:hypothetical protein D5S17_23910 [Pseudonocardiaceae bacterium YIM PH 21723]
MPAPAAHRLLLSAGEFRRLVELTETELPPGWAPPEADSDADVALRERGVLLEDGSVHPSVRMNLTVLSSPLAMVDTTVSIGDLGARSLHAVRDELGASLIKRENGAVELSLFAAITLGVELARAVPQPPQTGGIAARLGDSAPAPLPAGVLPLEALQEIGQAQLLLDSPAAVLDRLSLSPAESALAKATVDSDGGLQAIVTTRQAVGLVTWLHLPGGWVGVRPVPDGSGRKLVRLEPTERTALGSWAAPVLAGAFA